MNQKFDYDVEISNGMPFRIRGAKKCSAVSAILENSLSPNNLNTSLSRFSFAPWRVF